MPRWMTPWILTGALLTSTGCNWWTSLGSNDPDSGYGYGASVDAIQFNDRVENAADPNADMTDLTFVDTEGKPVALKDYIGKKNLVVVMTRGYAGGVCLYCSTHTSRLIANSKKFAERDAEVVIIFPVENQQDADHSDELVQSANKQLEWPPQEFPFPILLDVELKAVKQLGIEAHLAKPATYILDKQGRVRFAYVGSSLRDRPSVKAILEQLDALGRS